MCSACLTPVYPMEKMTANKVTLHYNCFCCKHCGKKLSIQNYSSVCGEFYCISHYQQLFKRRGNYDEGFGHAQHKNRWLPKSRGMDEPDVKSAPITRQTKSNPSGSCREFTTDVFVRESRCKSAAEAKGKLITKWPPEKKKTTGPNQTPQTFGPLLTNIISDVGKAAPVINNFAEHRRSDRVGFRGEIRDQGVMAQSRSEGLNSVQRFPSKKTIPATNVAKERPFLSSSTRNISSPRSGNGATVTNQNMQQTREATGSHPNCNQMNNRLNDPQSKGRKSVRFAPNVAMAHYEGVRDVVQVNTSAQEGVDESEDGESLSDNPRVNHSISNLIEEQREANQTEQDVNDEINEVNSDLSNEEQQVEVQSSREELNTDVTALDGGEQQGDELLHIQDQTLSPAHSITQPEQSGRPDVIPEASVNIPESETPNIPGDPGEHTTVEEVSRDGSEKQIEKTGSTDNQEKTAGQKKPAARTNSSDSAAKQGEKAKSRLGSWSKRKSPLSKLFTAGGNDSSNKTEPKKSDGKPGGGLLGRLLHKEVVTKSTDQKGKNEKTHTPDQRNETVTGELQKEGETPDLPKPSEPNTPENTMITRETGRDPPAPTDVALVADGESRVHSSEAVSQSDRDPMGESTDLLPVNTERDEPPSSTPERSSDQCVSDRVTGDIFGDDSAFVCPPSSQIKTGEFASTLTEQLGATQVAGNMKTDFSFDLNHENPEESFDCFAPASNSLDSLEDTTSPTVDSDQSLSLIVSHPPSAEDEMIFDVTDQQSLPESATPNRAGSEILDPFSAETPAGEQVIDFDFFGPSDDTLNPPPSVVAVTKPGEAAAFPDDIFGSSSVFPVSQNIEATADSLGDFLSSGTSADAPSAQIDIFADDIFGLENQLLPVSQPSDPNVFMDAFLTSENVTTEPQMENPSTNNSWMDDLLG